MDFMESTLIPEERPSFVAVYDSLPRTPLGKVDYPALSENAQNIENLGKDEVLVRKLTKKHND